MTKIFVFGSCVAPKISMKICYIGDAQSTHIQKWLKFFSSRGHDVHIISERNIELEGVHFHQLPSKKTGIINFIDKTLVSRKLIIKISPDIVHAHYLLGYGFFAAFSNVHPLVVDVMGDDIGSEPEKSRMMKWMAGYVMGKADLICVRDPFAMDRAVELGGPRSRMVIRYAFCRVDIFKPEARSEELRVRLGIDQSKSVMYLRPISAHYRSASLFEAIPKIVNQVPDVKFVIVNHGELKDSMIDQMRKQNVMNNIVLIDMIPHDIIQQYLASVDLCIDTFYATSDVPGGGIGAGIMEAMACGTPVLVPDRREYTNPLFKGATFIKGNASDLAHRAISLLQNGAERHEISRNMREMAVNVGNETRVMGEYEHIYQDMIEKSNMQGGLP